MTCSNEANALVQHRTTLLNAKYCMDLLKHCVVRCWKVYLRFKIATSNVGLILSKALEMSASTVVFMLRALVDIATSLHPIS